MTPLSNITFLTSDRDLPQEPLQCTELKIAVRMPHYRIYMT